MLVNARSLLNFDRRNKFENAVMTSRYPIIIVAETWWNEDMDDSELMLPGYILLRCERAVSKHGMVLVAIQSIISAKRISDDLPDGCILTIVNIQLKKNRVCVIYNPPLDSAYKYTLADFEQVLRVIEEFKQYACLICGDFNIPKVNWSLNHSADEYKQSVIEMFERHSFHQIVDFSICGKNTLDLVFERKVENTTAKIDLVFRQLFDVSGQEPILIPIKEHRKERKTPVSNKFSFCNADYDAMRREMTLFSFEATCFTNIDLMVEDLYGYIKSLIEKHCPTRTPHRQLVPPWFSRETSHTMKMLSTARRAHRKKPNSLVLSEKALRLENMLQEFAEDDRCQYQQKFVTTRDLIVIFKHLKSLRKTVTLPKILSLEEETADSTQQKLDLVNRYFLRRPKTR